MENEKTSISENRTCHPPNHAFFRLQREGAYWILKASLQLKARTSYTEQPLTKSLYSLPEPTPSLSCPPDRFRLAARVIASKIT